jgi:hypothetical protein
MNRITETRKPENQTASQDGRIGRIVRMNASRGEPLPPG